jgi:hypothetical protein
MTNIRVGEFYAKFLQSPLLQAASVAGILLLLVLSAGPVWDIDYWWHLATGRWIVEHGRLPEVDPFCQADCAVSAGRELILRAYWLSQVLLFLSWKALGDYGAQALRCGVVLAIALMSFFRSSSVAESREIWLGLFLAVLVGVALGPFSAIRPAMFSFLLFPVLLLAWDCWKRNDFSAPHALFLIVTMAVWSNMHGGFILGVVVVGLLVCGHAVSLLAGKTGSWGKLTLPLLGLVAVFVASLASPNGLSIYRSLLDFEGSILQGRTAEYVSPVSFVADNWPAFPLFWLALALTPAIVFQSWRQRKFEDVFVVAFLAVISLSAIRYVPFFLLAWVKPGSEFLRRAVMRREPSEREIQPVVSAAVFLAVLGAVIAFGNHPSSTFMRGREFDRFPIEAVEQMEKSEISGRLFNHFNWGGYLIWQLWPGSTTFIDGRNLDLEVFRDYTHILWDRQWALALLDKHGCEVALFPTHNPATGERYPLQDWLLEDPRWTRVSAERGHLLFIRD